MQSSTTQRPLTERFWSLAEASERAAVVDRSRPVGVVRHVLELLSALDAGKGGGVIAPSTRAFLLELANRGQLVEVTYSSPQHDAGDSALIFSIGILLFEGLSRRHLLGTVEQSRRIAQQGLEEITALVANAAAVPPALRTVITRALSPMPEQGFPSVAALRAELEWFLVSDGGSAPARPAARAPRAVTRPVGPLPSILVDPRVTKANRPRSPELELETALVPRLDATDLEPARPRRKSGPRLAVSDDQVHRAPRRSQPRQSRNELVRLAALFVLLAIGSAVVTGAAMYFSR